jgi:hypothetical protein
LNFPFTNPYHIQLPRFLLKVALILQFVQLHSIWKLTSDGEFATGCCFFSCKKNAPNKAAPTTPITPRILLLLASTCTEAKNFSMRNKLIKSKQIELRDVGFTTTTMMRIPQSQYHYVPTPGGETFH